MSFALDCLLLEVPRNQAAAFRRRLPQLRGECGGVGQVYLFPLLNGQHEVKLSGYKCKTFGHSSSMYNYVSC